MKRTVIYLLTTLTVITALCVLWFLKTKQKEEVLIIKPATTSTIMPQSDRPKFMPNGRGCGSGYVQGYELPDGQQMVEGTIGYPSKRQTKNKYNEWLAKATRIIERVPEFKDRFGKIGERIVILFPPDAAGKQWATILWYDGGSYFSYIKAPSVDLALEFERSNAYAY